MENGPWELFYVRLRKIKLVFSSKNESRDDKIQAEISLVAKKNVLEFENKLDKNFRNCKFFWT